MGDEKKNRLAAERFVPALPVRLDALTESFLEEECEPDRDPVTLQAS
jgi:hypothetical protein